MTNDKLGPEVGAAAASSRAVRRRRYFSGLAAERIAAVYLMLKGYRILGMRVRTAAGEIDLIALRWRRLAFVEVKRRASLAEAEASVTANQRRRIRSAAQIWLARNPRMQDRDICFDLVFLVGRRWPLHLVDGL